VAKKGHTEEQILRALRQAEGGTRVSDICREHGISEATYYVWKKKYSGLGLSEAARTPAVARGEREAQAVGRGSLTGSAHAAGDRPKKAVRPRHRRELGRWTQTAFAVSTRRVAGLMMINRSTMTYLSRRDPQDALRMRLQRRAACASTIGV